MKIAKVIAEINNVSVGDQDNFMLNEISFRVHEKEAWAITGKSGSGKTTLAKILAGLQTPSAGDIKYFLSGDSTIAFIDQQHNFRDFNSRAYYQQRFESNFGTESPFVEDFLQQIGAGENELKFIVEALSITHILKSRLIELSNGEGKRVQLAKALLNKPDVLILDNPFLGLDMVSRKLLHEIINTLVHRGIIIFLVTTADEIPDSISHVLELEKGQIKKISPRNGFKSEEFTGSSVISINLASRQVLKSAYQDFEIAVGMSDVNVAYNGKIILENINWTVKKGEQWALMGHNGAGKTTLLSLINGDNPKAYSNDITLFDKKRGSGESIWDIKNKIGYISPELHNFYQRTPSFTEKLSISGAGNSSAVYYSFSPTCFDVIASGFNEQVGGASGISSLQQKLVLTWMEILNIAHLKKQTLLQTSLGEQRIVLLARALVKDPPLLILDEPCQGLDKFQIHHFKNVIEEVCCHFNKTLIYVSHYEEEIPGTVNKYLKLEKGRIVA